MPKYICFFSYTREAGKAMIEKPTDRVAAAKALVESAGGKMECFYWMHGHHDGFFIADYKDGMSAAAVAAAAGSTGAITQIETLSRGIQISPAMGIENSPPWLRFGLFRPDEASLQLLLEPVRIAADVKRHGVMQ